MEIRNGGLAFTATLDNNKLREDARESQRILHGVGNTAVQEGSRMDSAMAQIGTAVAGAFAVDKLKDFALQVAKVRGEFQQLEVAFKTMLGSQEKADALMSQLITTAAKTPFGMSDIANSAKQLIAYGVEANEVNETLIRLGDIAAGLSIPINDLAFLYGSTMVQGRMYTQDLNQFLSRGIPLTKELARQFGVAENEVKMLVEEGKVGFPQLQQAVISMTSEGGKFGGLMEAQSKTITGQISNIEDSIEQMFNTIGKQSEGAIDSILGGIGFAVEHWESIAKAIGVVITVYGAYKGATLAIIAAKKIEGFVTGEVALQQKLAAMSGITLNTAQSAAAAGTALLTRAMNSLKVALLSNPITMIATVVATAATAMIAFGNETETATEMSTRFGEKASEATTKVEGLYSILRIAKEESQTYKTAKGELIETLENYGIHVDKEKVTTEELIALHEQLIATIKEESIERERANAIDTFNSAYVESVKNAVKEAQEALEGVKGGSAIVSVGFDQVLDAKALEEYSQALKEHMELFDKANKGTYTGESFRKDEQAIRLRLDTLKKAQDETLRSLSRQAGMTEEEINAVVEAYDDYRRSVAEAYSAQQSNIRMANDVATALDKQHRSVANLTNEQALLATKMSILKNHSDNLRSYLEALAKEYKITLNFEQVNVPQWMQGVSSLDAKALSAHYAAQLQDMSRRGVTKRAFKRADGTYETLSREQVAERSYAYAKQAQEAEAKEKEKKKAKEEADAKAREEAKQREKEAKAEAKRKASAAKRKAEEARRKEERIEAETAERLQAIKQQQQTIAQATEEAELELSARRVEAMDEGYEKEKAQIELNYKRLKAENDKRREDMLKAVADIKINQWRNQHPEATRAEEAAYRLSLFDNNSPNRLGDKDLNAQQLAQLKAYEKINAQIKEQAERKLYERILSEYRDFEARRTEEAKKYDEERRKIEALPIDQSEKERAIVALEEKRKKSIKAINDEEIESVQKASSLFVKLFGDASEKSTKEIRSIVTETEALLDYLKNTAGADLMPKFGFTAEQLRTLQASPEKIKEITKKVKELKEAVTQSNPFKEFADALKDLLKPKAGEGKDREAQLKKLAKTAVAAADVIGNVAGQLSQMFAEAGADAMADMADTLQGTMASVSNVAKGFAEGGVFGGVMAGIGEAIGWATKAFQANARHKAALKEILKETTAQQRAYNLALLEEKLTAEGLNTVFGALDYKKAVTAVATMKDAHTQLNTALAGTATQQAKMRGGSVSLVGLKRVTQQYNALQKAYAGLASIEIKTGHKKTGIFGLGKGKDLYSSILEQYPELIDKSGKFNRTLAQTILDTKTFKDEGKEALQNMIALYDEAEKAHEEMKSYLSGIFGELGNTMSDALSEAFSKGTDAAQAFAESVEAMLENIGKQMVFSTLFSGIIEKANEEMLNTMKSDKLTDEQKFNAYLGTLEAMTSNVLAQQGTYNDLMNRYKEMASGKGLSIFDGEDKAGRAGRTPSQRGIATASQDSIDELNGRMTAVQGHTFSIMEQTRTLVTTTGAILKSVVGIERNTNDVPTRLASMEANVSALKETLNDMAIKGIKIK